MDLPSRNNLPVYSTRSRSIFGQVGVEAYQYMQMVVHDREPGGRERENIRKFLEALFDPFSAVDRAFTQQERATHTARDARVRPRRGRRGGRDAAPSPFRSSQEHLDLSKRLQARRLPEQLGGQTVNGPGQLEGRRLVVLPTFRGPHPVAPSEPAADGHPVAAGTRRVLRPQGDARRDALVEPDDLLSIRPPGLLPSLKVRRGRALLRPSLLQELVLGPEPSIPRRTLRGKPRPLPATRRR